MLNAESKRLGDILNFKRGYDLPVHSRQEGIYPVISFSGISGYHVEYKADGEGIVTGRYGTLGKMYYINGKYWPHNTALYVTDFKENFPKYIYYLLTCIGKVKTSDKSAVPVVNRNELHEVLVPFLPRNLQENAASILSALDAKIELNNCINAKLEAMAKMLYDYWFVQFDFPDGKGNPYKSSGGKMVYNKTLKREIPQGWEVKNVSSLLFVKTGKEDANFSTENGDYAFFTCGEETLKCNEYVFEGKAILLAGNGSFAVKKFNGKFNAYQRTYVLIADDEKYYAPIFYAVKDTIKKLTSRSRGSIVKFITKGDIEEITLTLPQKGKNELFNTLNTIFHKISINDIENQKLVELRDWLLPMLMNGQVKVK